MTLLQAIFMGIIQGLTEFLPVSSSGHLALFKILFGVETDTGLLYDVLLHVGTLLAICAVYYKDIGRMLAETVFLIRDAAVNLAALFTNAVLFVKARGGRGSRTAYRPYRRMVGNSYRKMVALILVSTVPTGIIGYFGRDAVELASQLLIVPGICLIATGVLLLIADAAKGGEKLPREVTYTNAFVIGIAQGVATLPGLSRSGTTITACLLSGFSRSFAVKYSFLMSIPAVLGAMVLELKDVGTAAVTGTQTAYYLIGMAVAAVIGYICIKTMLIVVRKKKFRGFAIYCFAVGVLSVGGYFYTI